MKLRFSKNARTEVYCDADWANDKEDLKSVCGFVIIMSGGAVAWKSKKQNLIATSTVEAEYVSITFVVLCLCVRTIVCF